MVTHGIAFQTGRSLPTLSEVPSMRCCRERERLPFSDTVPRGVPRLEQVLPGTGAAVPCSGHSLADPGQAPQASWPCRRADQPDPLPQPEAPLQVFVSAVLEQALVCTSPKWV